MSVPARPVNRVKLEQFMTLHAAFYNNSGRLRSGWRFAMFLLMFIFASLVLSVVMQGISAALNAEFAGGSGVFLLVSSILSLAAALAVGWLAGRFFEGLPFRALGASFTSGWAQNLVLGLLIGGATITLAVAIAFIGGNFRLKMNSAPAAAIADTAVRSLVIFAAAAAFEEALFRGYILQTFSRAGLAWFAIAMTSAFFGVVHLGNPNAGIISTANTVLAGVWFGVAYLKTRDLWFPFALHFVWNWMQGSVFGIEVSGLTEIVREPLFREADAGPVWLTGGDYGIEGGIACTIAIAASIAAIHFIPWTKADAELLAMSGPEFDRVNTRESVS